MLGIKRETLQLKFELEDVGAVIGVDKQCSTLNTIVAMG